MKRGLHLRGVATAVLQCALKVAPPYAAEWGRAMLGEMHHVQNDWDAFMWAASGASVLTKHALFSLMIPGYASEIATSDSKFFAKENPMRKSTLIAAAVCLAATLLFFALPTFRQAFQISLAQGSELVSLICGNDHGSYSLQGPYFYKVAEEAKKNRDAEGLAFAAIHRRGTAGSAELGAEAIRLDPKLTWIYAFLVNGNWSVAPPTSEVEWISKLQQFDPENALPHLIHAQQLESGKHRGEEIRLPAWQSAMAAAFAASKLDTYGDRLKELDYRVALRYGLTSPYETANLSGYFSEFIFPQTGDPKAYAKLLLDSGDALAAHGDQPGAAKKYLLAAHFGEMIRPGRKQGVETFIRSRYVNSILQGPYRQLAKLYEKQGDPERTRLFSVLAARATQEEIDDMASFNQLIKEQVAIPWNAPIMNFSAILMLFSAGIIFLCMIDTIARSQSIQLSKLRIRRADAILGVGGLVGLLFSAVTLYLGYRPYAEIIRSYLRDGDPSRLRLVTGLFDSIDYSNFYNAPHYLIYFWVGIIVLGMVALVFMTVRLASQSRQLVSAI